MIGRYSQSAGRTAKWREDVHLDEGGRQELSGRKRKVSVYPITGRQLGFLSVPHRFCEECDQTIRLVRRVAADMEGSVEVEVRPWLRYVFDALRRGGWHAPVVAIDGRLFSQGVVPDETALRTALEQGAPAGDEGDC